MKAKFMNKLNMFCLTMEPNHFQFINEIGYTPVGLGENSFGKGWFTDKNGENISKKNKYYGEYTYHYWLWKNYLDQIDEGWIGFCQYRKFWSTQEHKNESINLKNINGKVLKYIPESLNEYETILGKPIFINQFKSMKFIKKGFKLFLKNPTLVFNKNKRSINFHFNLMHGENNLNKAIELLDNDNKNDFKDFVNSEVSFNPHNMFICNSKIKLKKYYETLFEWLLKCEKIFGFEDLKGYDKTRIYGFLAERFLSYWFKKNTKYTTLPIIFYDIRNDLN